jgi:hypothetical protein
LGPSQMMSPTATCWDSGSNRSTLEGTLRQVLPGCTDDEIRSLGRSLRRTFVSALIGRAVTPDEMRDELLSLIRGWPAAVRKSLRPERQLAIALSRPRGFAVGRQSETH